MTNKIPRKTDGTAVTIAEARARIEHLTQNPGGKDRNTQFLFTILRAALMGRTLRKEVENQRNQFRRALEQDPELRARAEHAIQQRTTELLQKSNRNDAIRATHLKKRGDEIRGQIKALAKRRDDLTAKDTEMIANIKSVLDRVPRLTAQQHTIKELFAREPDLRETGEKIVEWNSNRIQEIKKRNRQLIAHAFHTERGRKQYPHGKKPLPQTSRRNLRPRTH